MEWRKARGEWCYRCGKAVSSGRKLGMESGVVYCYRCGHNRELAGFHRLYGKLDREAASHLRSIGVR